MDKIEEKVVIREYNEEIDIEVVKKLEKNCNVESQKGISIYTSFKDDPLCRIRFYPIHTMLVAELLENGELVGTVRGCIKCVGTGFGERYVKLGSILGLRVSPSHRRMGIGLKLVQSIEEWMIKNDAEYTLLATEKENLASINLFTLKCSYENLSSLFIYIQPITTFPLKDPSQDIKIEKLPIDQANSFYNNTHIGGNGIYPRDIDAILKEKMSLGTWVCYFNDMKDEGKSIISRSSWAVFSIWNNSCEPYNTIQAQNSPPPPAPPCKCLHSALSHARKKISPCLNCKIPFHEGSVETIFGFLFLFGIHGEGERIGELMESLWGFASGVAEKMRGCNAIMTELGVSDPLREHVPQGPSISCIEDLWYLKRLKEFVEDELTVMLPLGNVFVDPRDF